MMTPAAIAALTTRGELQTVARCAVQPHDVLVVTVAAHLGSATIAHIVHVVKGIWPGHQVLVLDPDITLDIVAGVLDES